MKNSAKLQFCICLLIIPFLSQAQTSNDPSILSLERIFSSSEFSSDWFGPARWIDSGDGYTTLENSADHPGYRDIVRYETSSGGRTILVSANKLVPEGAEDPLYVENYHWSEDKSKLLIYTNSKRVWRQNTRGDYWVLDLQSWSLKQLGGIKAAPSTLMFAKFSPDGGRVAYVRENNIYVERLSNNEIATITNDGTRKIINGTFDWVYEEEFSCRDGFRWSPDGESIAYWQLDAHGIRDFYMINNTDSVYSRMIPVQYPKAGMSNSACKVGVVSAKGGSTTWMKVEGDPRNNYIPRMMWAANSDELIIQHLNRRQDHNKVTICNAKTGEVDIIYEDKDEAWLDVVEDLKFLKEGKYFTWVSEKNGWKNVYQVSRDGKSEKMISPDGIDVVSIQLIDEKGGWLYYMASPGNATQRYLYRNRINGKIKPERLSPADQPGTHSYQISPNAKWAIHTYSRAGTPPVISLISLPDHKAVRVLVDNKKLIKTVEKIKKSPVEFFTIDVDEGISLDAYMIKPTDFDPTKKYPVLFHVYGEPWGQTVLDSWGWSNYLWHTMLTQQGYIVMSVDNRGTPGPKGREWRKCVHGQIGVLASADQASAVKEIIKRYDFIDEDRIGIWGWSGGGAMTLNAMFRYPETYKTGMSVAPVTNQLLYDNIYQERYSGLPAENPEGYKKGSPINFAKNLKGNLLLVHGTGDDNVHYQNTEVLINELVKHNKLFSLMSYPNRSHGIYEGRNTSRHLRETLTWYLKNNLPAGPK
ncbi:S9 family peptidase [Fulvivirgaceae bacterium BMA10]|uniref:S9 family peptidase n=1 Tax=Splendidivirga corallicola TaxID=3051826 RepID=A0ABT8KH91_9BACT|nr:S9 family peptidase [Fulvivirgaceae bacterium BMA10]